MHAVAHLVHAYGLLVVAGVIGLEAIGIPVPGETALIVGSVVAGTTHDLNIIAVVVVATAASVAGRVIGYLVGAQFGYWLLLRYGFYLRITEARIKLGQYLFLRHGGKIIIVAQFVPFLRSIAGILAGANRMPLWHFIAASAVGSLVWSASFGTAAYSFGRKFTKLAASWGMLSSPTGWLIFGAVVVIVVLVLAAVVGRHEAQLCAKAERALPGPLRLP